MILKMSTGLCARPEKGIIYTRILAWIDFQACHIYSRDNENPCDTLGHAASAGLKIIRSVTVALVRSCVCWRIRFYTVREEAHEKEAAQEAVKKSTRRKTVQVIRRTWSRLVDKVHATSIHAGPMINCTRLFKTMNLIVCISKLSNHFKKTNIKYSISNF